MSDLPDLSDVDNTFMMLIDDKDSKEVNEWVRFGMRMGVAAALHPFEYAKVLVQIGYEPVPPYPGRSLFGAQRMMLPNIFQYAAYIRRRDGFYGCYRGLSPKIAGSLVAMICSDKIATALGIPTAEDCKHKNDVALDDEELYIQFKLNLKRDLVIGVTSIVVAHPFHVMSLRMMAQFVGGEKIYQSIIGSVVEIYKTEGLGGFFNGLVPKLLGEIACLVLTSSTVFMLNKYIIKDKIGRHYNSGFTQFAVASILYPFQVVATCMAVTGSRLMAGTPPIMPIYKNSYDCWNDLQLRGELKRGNSFFWRFAPEFKGTHRIQHNSIPVLPTISKYQ